MNKQKQNQMLTVFKRWSGKRFAVFCSLKRTIKIGCLLVVYLKFANPGTVLAQEPEGPVYKSYDLEEIDITEDIKPASYSEVARVVQSIGREEIERAAVSSINELIELAANVDIRQRGSNGAQADVSIRGGSFDQVLLLLNGVNITDPQTGHHNLNLPVDFSAIERIEILKGPGAWRFGPGAFSGAINIVTRSVKENFLYLGAEAGSYQMHGEKLLLSVLHQNTGHLLSANHLQTDGHIQNTDFRYNNLFYRVSRSNDTYSLGVQLGYTEKAFGANSFYSPKFPNQYEETNTLFSSFEFRIKAKQLILEPKVYYRRNNDHFLLMRDQPALYSNFHTTESWGSNLLANYLHSLKSVSTLGFDVRTETIYSTNLGEVASNPVFCPMNDSILLNRFHSRAQWSVFLGHKYYFSKVTLSGGINFTRNSDLGLKWFVYPGLDMVIKLGSYSHLKASISKSMRMPSYTDLFYQGPNNEGNPALKPEEIIGYELGYKFEYNWMKSSLTGFYSGAYHLIDWVKEKPEEKWRTINYSRINTSGIEVAMQANLEKAFKNHVFVNNISVQYTYLLQDKAEQEYLSNYALNYLKHRIDISLDHQLMNNLTVNWHFSWQDRFGTYEEYENQQFVQLSDYKPFYLINLKANLKYRGWMVSGSINNLINIEYIDYGNIRQPGRWYKIGISKQFGLSK